jgi:hypothetical protein
VGREGFDSKMSRQVILDIIWGEGEKIVDRLKIV